MFSEKEIISFFLSQLPVSRDREHQFFESDAEIVRFGNERLLFTTDEFSLEDLFREEDPFVLGWNLAVATISDVLASGGRPSYFGHSASVSKNWTEDYIRGMARGIGEVLKMTDTAFIGGDLGVSDNWKYTGICLGTSENPITRKGAKAGEKIYMTGQVGAGNLEAALFLNKGNEALSVTTKNFNGRFFVRDQESRLIARYASCCMDSSDGVLNTVNTLADINEVGYVLKNLPYLCEGVQACNFLGLPPALLFMGECGEYELVFTIDPAIEEEFLNQAGKSGLKFALLGITTEILDKVLEEDDIKRKFNDFKLSARGYSNVNLYLIDLVKYLSYE